MTAVLGVYGAFARVAFLQILAYRLRYVTGILTYTVYVSCYSFLWRGIYGTSGRLGAFDAGEMVHFVAIGWILRSFYFNNVDREIAEEVRQGKIGARLLLPVSYPLAKLVGAAGESFFRLAFFTGPIALVVGILFDVPLPAGWQAAAGTAASAVLALGVMSGLNFLVALAAFPLKNIDGLIWTKHGALQILSGLLIPLSFFPPAAARILEVLPFAAISQSPVLIYMGRLAGPALARELLFQAAWAAGLWGIGAWLWGRAIRRLTIQGG